MHLTGIIDAQAFRAQIMQAREALRHPPQARESDAQLLVLRSIESRLSEIADLLRAKP
jgi:putative membrane protein